MADERFKNTGQREGEKLGKKERALFNQIRTLVKEGRILRNTSETNVIKAIPTSLLLDSVSFSLIDEIKRYRRTNSCFVLGFYLFIIFLSTKERRYELQFYFIRNQ